MRKTTGIPSHDSFQMPVVFSTNGEKRPMNGRWCWPLPGSGSEPSTPVHTGALTARGRSQATRATGGGDMVSRAYN